MCDSHYAIMIVPPVPTNVLDRLCIAFLSGPPRICPLAGADPVCRCEQQKWPETGKPPLAPWKALPERTD